MQDESRLIPKSIAQAELADVAAREAAGWGKRYAMWLGCAFIAGAVLLLSVFVAAGLRGSTGGRWLRNLLPVIHARVCYRPIEYRALVFGSNSYELYEGYAREYHERYDELLGEGAAFVEVTIFVFDRAESYGWWGLTRKRWPLTFWWDAWDEHGHARPNMAVYERIREEIVNDQCGWGPAVCARYREAIAGGSMGEEVRGSMHRETFAVTRMLWFGYVHNIATIAAVVLLPMSVRRALGASRQCSRWRRMCRVMTCPMCDYDLRGLPRPRCPECGFEIGGRRC